MTTATHNLSIEDAVKYGTDAALLLHHFRYWVTYNKTLKRNLHEGKYWTYQTIEELSAHFPYMTKEKIVNEIERLCLGRSRFSKSKEKEFDPVLQKGNFNKTKYDRTLWYSFVNDPIENVNESTASLCKHKMDPGETQKDCCVNTKPIPDDKNTYIKQSNIYVPPDESNPSQLSRLPTNEPSAIPPKVGTPSLPSLKKEKKKVEVPPEATELANLLWSYIQAIHPNHKPPNLIKWSETLFKCHLNDHRSWKDLRDVLDYVFKKDAFWVDVMQSAESLRKNFDKIWIKMHPAQNEGKQVEENRATSYEAKRILEAKKRGSDLHIHKDSVTFSNGESISMNLPPSTFEDILAQRLGLRRSQ